MKKNMKKTEAPKEKKPKEKVDFKSLLRLVIYCKQYRVGIIFCVILSLANTFLSIYSPEVVSDLTDTFLAGIEPGLDLEKILRISMFLAIIYALTVSISYIYSVVCESISQNTAYRMRRDITEKLTRLPLKFSDGVQRGEFLSRTTNDVEAVSDALTKNVSALFSAAVLFVGVMWKMFAVSVKLTLIAITFSVLGTAFTILTAVISQKYYVRSRKDLGAFNGLVEEVFHNNLLVNLFYARKSEGKRFDEINNRLFDSQWKSTAISVALSPMISVLSTLSNTLILVIGCSMLLEDPPLLTYGALTAFTLYADMFSSPLSTFASSVTSLQKTAASTSRIFQLLDETEQEDESDKPSFSPDTEGNIVFDHVCFSYTEDKPVIRDLNLDIHAGEKIAIVGPSGVGKTTLVNLLMRFYDVEQGEIRIDGKRIRDYKRESVRSLFDMVLQDTWLFEGSIRENLTFGKENVSDEAIQEVCRSVGIADLINSMPQGYDTQLKNLSGLSEGQRQQLTIARMMLEESPFLIFDEATSALDSRTEMLLQTVLQKHMQGKTCFMIAHRLSTIRNADRIIVMKDGTVAESGTHAELLALNGVYRSMYDLQMQGSWENDTPAEKPEEAPKTEETGKAEESPKADASEEVTQ